MDCVNELVNLSNTVYEYCEGTHYLHNVKNLSSDLEYYFQLANDVNRSIADQADELWNSFSLDGNSPGVRPSAEEVDREYYKRYNEVQLLYDEVKFKIDTTVADLATSAFTAVVERASSSTASSPVPKNYQSRTTQTAATPASSVKGVEKKLTPDVHTTRRTLCFDSLAAQVSPVVVVEAGSAAAPPDARTTGHAPVPPDAPPAAATAPPEAVVEASSLTASPETRATGHV